MVRIIMRIGFTTNFFAVFTKSLLFVCLSVASVVIFANVANAATEYSTEFPLATPDTETPLGLNGLVIFDTSIGQLPVLSATGTLTQMQLYLRGGASTTVLQLVRFNNLDCKSEVGKTVGDYGISGIAQLITLNFTGSQCSLIPGQRVEFRLSVGSGSGIQSMGRSGIQSFRVSLNGLLDSIDFDFSNKAGFNSVTNTRFLTLGFTGDQANVSYFLDLNEVDNSVPSRNPTLVRFSYAKKPNLDFSAKSFNINNTISATSSVNGDLSALVNGTYDLLIQFSNLGVPFGGVIPFPESYIYATIDKVGNNITLVNTAEFYDGQSSIDDDMLLECSIYSISGCIINSFRYLFIPSTSSFNNFSLLNETLSGKFPFAYAYGFNDSINTLYNSGQIASSEITVPFGTFGNITLLSSSLIASVPFAALIKMLLGYLIWLMFAIQVYRRTLTVFNTNPA
jgi:hypothetical protein